MYEMNRDGLPLARGAGLSMVQYIFHKVSITLYGLIGFLCLLFAKDEKKRQEVTMGTESNAEYGADQSV